MKLAFQITAIATVLFTLACGGRRVRLDDNMAKAKGGVMGVSAEWIKDKKKKFDVMVTIENFDKKPIVFKASDLKCKRGDSVGRIYSDLHSHQRMVVLDPEETRTVLIKCHFSDQMDGDFKLAFKSIYRSKNDSGDRGRVLDKDFEWTLPEAEGMKK